MCWICDQETRSTIWLDGAQDVRLHLAEATTGAIFAAQAPSDGLIVVDDAIPDDSSSTQTLSVDGAAIVSTLEMIGDQDYYRIQLVGGQTYEIGMYAKYGGPNGIPLLDSLFEIRDASGSLLTNADSGGQSLHNFTNPGFDALISFVAPATGLYYINARSYDDDVTGDGTGNYVGDYELFARTPAGSLPPPPTPPSESLFLTTTDTAGNDLDTTATIAADGPPVISTIDAPKDQDFYKIEMEAGKAYRINQSAEIGGPSGVPLGDAYFEIYDPSGRLVGVGTAGGPMPGGQVTTTVNAQLDFVPTTSGTYYINARYANFINEDGSTTGEGVGDYRLEVESWTPYYTPDSPLYSIDWGTQIDGSSRNPDGAEGPRPTENEFTGHAWNPEGILGKNVVYYYYAKQGEVFVSEDPANPGLENMVASGFRDWEIEAYEGALDQFEKVADIVYIETDKREEADFVFITYDGTPDVGVLGRMSPPDTQNEGQTEFNRNGPGWDEEHLVQGAYSFGTLLHEMGHGHGLAHPHDNGGRSGVMRGVTSSGGVASYTTGAYDLNQGIYTLMSYNFGWPEAPHGNASSGSGYGYIGSLAAFDIAAIQDKYGVNEEWATGNDTYAIKDVNAIGTFYSAIWDAAGTDQIVYSGARDAVIDLRPASLQYEYGGGGWVSYALGIHGGYTIANSVTIENATSGSGKDNLTGNDAANVLNGGANADVMSGGKGNDTYRVDNAGDKVIEKANEGSDSVYASASFSLAPDSHVESLGTTNASDTAAINLGGSSSANSIYGNAGANTLNGGAGNDSLNGLGGNDLLIGGAGTDSLSGGAGNDSYRIEDGLDLVYEAAGGGEDSVSASVSYRLNSGASVELIGTTNAAGTGAIDLAGNDYNNSIYGNAGNNALSGDGGSDNLVGLAGNDVLIGGGGNDVLRGGAGADEYRFVSNLNSGNVDSILDFSAADDTIVLDDAVFAGLGLGGLAAGAFATGPAAADADDRIVYNSTTGALLFDADGNGAGAAIQFATLNAGLALTASDFT
ncbi:MAG TPA: M10 family metallopeptidase C-terminal domain-containing protein, partial [Allosphingosinicella sp.]